MKLFIPGPVHLRPEIRQEMSRTMVGHRDQAFVELFTPVLEKLKTLLYTEQHVFVATCSGSGLWEMGIRNLCRKKVLCATCGAFSERWADAAEANGRQVTRLPVEWGKPNLPDAIGEALGKDDYVNRPHQPARGDRRGPARFPRRHQHGRRRQLYGRA